MYSERRFTGTVLGRGTFTDFQAYSTLVVVANVVPPAQPVGSVTIGESVTPRLRVPCTNGLAKETRGTNVGTIANSSDALAAIPTSSLAIAVITYRPTPRVCDGLHEFPDPLRSSSNSHRILVLQNREVMFCIR